MKEMKYQKENKIEIIANGEDKGFKWCVVNLGSHPTCYVFIPNDHHYFERSYETISDIGCHGGLTFSGRLHFDPNQDWALGWDYAHHGDYMGYSIDNPKFNMGNKKWTTEELIRDVMDVITQLSEVHKPVKTIKERERFERECWQCLFQNRNTGCKLDCLINRTEW